MRRDQDVQMREAKKGYREAVTEGNREEEARWANVIGDILKNRGEYVEALRWLRLDYNVSLKYLPQKQLLPTCQSIGELYLRLNRHHEALHYQKKHLELAKASDDLIEQQRAATQLGRTYHEMFLQSEDDHDALRNAKKYFKSAMKLACVLKDNILCFKSSHFLKEYVDAHNNIGMLEMDLDNVEDAEKILLKGLKICDEEEVTENDDGRTRLHHNLGTVYLKLRDWAKSKKHIEIDIQICKRIGHPQGEAKGFINLGELHYHVQKYPEATNCYKKALEIANKLEDEDALVGQILQNLDIVKEAEGVLEDLKNEELKLKKLARAACSARGTSKERRYLLEQNTALDSLIDKARLIAAWKKHQEFAKRKKRVVTDLCDKEKMSDSYLVIGESYQKLRNFSKARKWYMKSWNTYRSIGNMEGQALAKINIGEVLDSYGNWAGALEAFEEGYKIAVQGNLPSVQLSALNNMHYSHMIRFDNEEDARKLQHEIQTLKCLLNEEDQPNGPVNEHCPETETEGLDMSDSSSSGSDMPDTNTSKPMTINPTDEIDDDIVLGSLVPPSKAKRKMSYNSCCKRTCIPNSLEEASSDGLSKSSSHKTLSRKRLHVVISDDEMDECNAPVQEKEVLNGCQENEATSSKDLSSHQAGISNTEKDVACSNPKDLLGTCTDRGKSTCSSSSKFPKPKTGENTLSESLSDVGGTNAPNSLADESRIDSHHTSGSLHQNQNGHAITFKMGSDLIHVDTSCCMDGDKVSIECLKVQIACQYYLQLPKEKRSKGLLPVFKNLALSETECGLLEISDGQMEIIADEWVPKRLMKSYIDNCEKKSEEPTMNLIKKLYNLEISEDEIVVSSCGLQDVSMAPFMDALSEHKTVTLLDVSHNALGNETMERLHQLFISSTQTYGSLVLDLHSNRFGPSSLFQICECPVFSARLEVLNVSENRLTDACSSYLTNILTNCKALYSLNIEKCGITTRTIQKIADVLDEGHVLSQLKIGRNSPISGSSVVKLLVKLTKLESFSELGLSSMKLNKNIINSLCQLIRTTSLSTLILDSANLGDEGALKVIETFPKGIRELVKLDLSNCGLNKKLAEFFTKVASLDGLHELNLGGNSFKLESCLALSPLLNPQSLKILILDKCGLGLNGILEVVKALKDNYTLEELHIADNANCTPEASPQQQHDLEAPDLSKPSNQPEPNVNLEYNDMEVADSEDELTKTEHPFSCLEGAHASSSTQKPFTGSDIVKELALAIAATRLLLIDLSSNGLLEKTVETLYDAWSSRPGIVAQKHVRQKIVHFSVEGKRCCGVRPCCRRDGLV